MYSNKSDYDIGQRRPHSSRGSRPWDEEERREEWKEPPRNSIQGPYDKYTGDGDSWSERVSSSDYNESYTREYISDTDWRNEHSSSHERDASEKRRRTLEDDDQYTYQHELKDSYRRSPEIYFQRNKDFKRTMSVEEGYSHRTSPEESRYSQHQEESRYSQYKEDSHYRPVAEYYKDRDNRERSRSPDRTRSRDAFMKSYTPPQPRSDSFSRDHENHNHNRTRFSLNGSSRLPESSHRRLSPPPPPPPPRPAAAAGEKKMSKGFQRFLDVLNMGVNVDTLTQIVTQGSPDVNVRHPSSPPHVDRPWTAEPSQRQQNPQYWPHTERSHQRPASPQSRSYSSNGKTMSEESSLETHHFEAKLPTKSPTINTLSFDEDHKRKQVHDVLQAIGIKLEFEELGQMSSRIQERLYGKKQTDNAPPSQKEEEEREKRRPAYIPKRRSRSSSGSSSSGSCQAYKKSHSYRAQWKEMNFPYKTDRTQQSPSNYRSQVISSSAQHRQNPEPHPAPMPSRAIPPPSPIRNCPPSPYPNLPVNLSPAMPSMFMSQPPPFFSPYPQTPTFPPPNIFPPAGPLSAPFPQQPCDSRRHPYLNLIMVPPTECSTFTKNAKKVKNDSNPPKRHRYLQQVPTKK